MAGTSPRRSIRSRTSQPQNSTSHHSSTSSSSSGRGDRTTRTSAKAESPRKLTSNESLSSEPLDDSLALSVEESLSTRRRKRGQADEQEKESKEAQSEMANGINEPAGEDDEAVRCICGSEEYPGPPQITEEDSKKGIKDATAMDLITPEDYTEDLAGFFLQCDMCKVWQHGGCVGIKNEDMSPDEYFCELCRKDLHKIYTASNEQKYSHYLPLYRNLSRSTSRAASFSKDGTRSPRGSSKNGRPTSSSAMQSANAKRRSTMNSRDAAYDEEEQLRRAIEASKGEKTESTDGGTRRVKRGRSDSEEKQEPSKRQRTLSASPSPQKEISQFAAGNESDDASNARNNGAKKIRGAAARNHREKELREEREKARLEAANKRKGRAERRRVDDSDQGEDTPSAAPTTQRPVEKPAPAAAAPPPEALASIQPTPESPAKPTPATNHKKGGRPGHARKGKVGKNQHTRDGEEGSPARSASREEHGGPREGRLGRPRGGGKVSMLDMKRRVAGMLEFIGRTQVEMAEVVRGMMEGLGGLIRMAQGEGGKEAEAEAEKGEKEKERGKGEFKELNLLEMMDVLTGELVKWQKAFT